MLDLFNYSYIEIYYNTDYDTQPAQTVTLPYMGVTYYQASLNPEWESSLLSPTVVAVELPSKHVKRPRWLLA